jgi:transcriptional regulator with XRE-family HTH domain
MSRKIDHSENTVGSRIMAVRNIAKLTQSAFADMIGITQSSISEYEANKKIPSGRLLKLISLTFSINEGWLITGEGEISCFHCGPDSAYGEGNNKDNKYNYSIQPQWNVSDALDMASRVLVSNTSYADALYVSIAHFDRALQAESRIMKMKQQCQDQAEDLSTELGNMSSKASTK